MNEDNNNIINGIKKNATYNEMPQKSSLKTFHRIFKQNALVTSNRVYCDNCGVFDDHITENCTDTQTF
ncbi:hypothetical protein MN116_006204 [Schistosoma mekongi]|uniref:CLIP1 zinc knuckle domain-containing protein n=1 Tax=Schistosoma mekongi TaxID=38744 RepID=A0AAE1ZBD0_SCHME|nr:hypothetical protein MN116_006204 [Schistosoma mekongi]